MNTEDKVRYGLMALSGAAVIAATLGIHFAPLDVAGGYGD